MQLAQTQLTDKVQLTTNTTEVGDAINALHLRLFVAFLQQISSLHHRRTVISYGLTDV
jgi:hypothetical protein